MKQSAVLCYCSTAMLASSTTAFQNTYLPLSSRFTPPTIMSPVTSSSLLFPQPLTTFNTPTTSTTSIKRLFFSHSNKYNDEDDYENEKKENVLKRIAKKVLPKSMLPKSMTQTPQEKKQAIERKLQKKSIEGGLSKLLQDFPLPIRMMGKMITPMLSTMASQMQEQSQLLEDVLDASRARIVNSAEVQQALGEPIVVKLPFRQSSSSMSVNGKNKSVVQVSFEVVGSRGYSSAIADLVAENGSIQRLTVNVSGGRSIDLTNASSSSSYSKRSSPKFGKNDIIDADVIDAEFVEKK